MHLRDTTAKTDPHLQAELARYSWSQSHGYWRHYKRGPDRGPVRNLFGMHELVWQLEYGVTVKNLDHINGDRDDNRLANLRPATRSLQALNSRVPQTKKSGLPKGVCLSTQRRFLAAVTYHGTTHNIGTFDDPEEASEAYKQTLDSLIEYEAAVARGDSPEKPVILVGRGPRKRGRPRKPERTEGRPTGKEPAAPLPHEQEASEAAPPAMNEKPHLGSRDAQELFEERAAIMEFDGGLSQASAEARALASLLAQFTLEDLPHS